MEINTSYDENKYTTLDNGELATLNDNQTLIKEMISNFGSYKFKNSTVTQDPEYPHRKNLIILAKDEKGKPCTFVFDMYGIKYIKLNDRKVASNQIQSKKQYLDLTADFTTKMIQVNNVQYKNTALVQHLNVIRYTENKIEELKSMTPKNEKERFLIQEEIMKKQNILNTHKYILEKIKTNLETSSASEK